MFILWSLNTAAATAIFEVIVSNIEIGLYRFIGRGSPISKGRYFSKQKHELAHSSGFA